MVGQHTSDEDMDMSAVLTDTVITNAHIFGGVVDGQGLHYEGRVDLYNTSRVWHQLLGQSGQSFE